MSGPVRLLVRYTTPDRHCKDMRYESDYGIGLFKREINQFLQPTVQYNIN